MTCYLVRHGKDDSSRRGGWSRFGLTEEGRQQTRDLAEHIRANRHELNIKKIYSSDLCRALETAQPVAAVLGLEVVPLPQLRETNNGLLAGMPNALAEQAYPGLYWSALEWDECYPGGENPCSFYERIKTAWADFSAAMLQTDENVMLVTHGGVIHVIFTLIEGRAFSNETPRQGVPHAALMPLRYENQTWQKI